ncbi:MAG: hypothetical protein KF712_14420 [Akkermansiaceae bacterium]|nr:hypothetical protein [Akkermansiaceae bacterium]
MISRFLSVATIVASAFSWNCLFAGTGESVIYRHDFGGAGSANLNSLALDERSGEAGGSASATWTAATGFKANGGLVSPAANQGMSAFVPFSPVNGHLYTISVDTTAVPVAANPTTTLTYVGISLYNATPNTAAAVGGQPVIATIARSPDNTPNAASSAGPFQILRRWHRNSPGTADTGLTQDHLGTLGSNAGTWRLSIQLNTANPDNWKYRWLVEDVVTSTLLSASHPADGVWPSVGSLGTRLVNSIQIFNHGPLASGAFGNFRVTAVPQDPPIPIENPDPPLIDVDYPGANVRVLSVTQPSSTEPRRVSLTPDQRHMQPGQTWFYWSFRTRDTAGFTAVFNSADHIGLRGPAVSYDEGKTWAYLGAGSVMPGRAFYVPPVPEGGEARYAFCPQYQQSHFDGWRSANGSNPHLEVTELCRSRNNRGAELVRIGKPVTDTSSEIILLATRHHSCEVLGSYVLEGFLQAALADDVTGRNLRKRTILAVPFMDKDGVEEGDQGKNRNPHDHNRDYNATQLYPEVTAVMQLGAQYHDRVVAFFDLHCPSAREEGMYFVGAPQQDVAAGQQAFLTHLAATRQGELPVQANDILPFGQGWNTSANYSQGRNSSAWARDTFPSASLITTAEISYSVIRGVEVTQERAKVLGADFARALATYLPAPAASVAEIWLEEAFGEDVEDPAISGWTMDPDHDGLSNLAEYAFGLRARHPDANPVTETTGVAGLPAIRAIDTPEGRSLRFEYIRRKASSNPGITYIPQISENLLASGEGAWRAVTAVEEISYIDDAWERVIIHVPSGVPVRFARVLVSTH